jgi:hypothetical protein
LVRKSNENIC